MSSTPLQDLARKYGLYGYEPLQSSIQEIRLLRLVSNKGSQIKCEMKNFLLSETPDYSALSYEWGNSTRGIPIFVNDRVVGITRSLEVFLLEAMSRCHRDLESFPWLSGWFWIDAVCINQDDRRERSEQIAFMKDIYEKAKTLVMWLGKAPVGGKEAIEFLKKLASLQPVEDEDNLDDRGFPLPLCEIVPGPVPKDSRRILRGDAYLEFGRKTWEAVFELFHSTYWDRAWILQEASTPKFKNAAWVCCDGLTVSWRDLALANYRLTQADWNNKIPQFPFRDPDAVISTNITTTWTTEQSRRAKRKSLLLPTLSRSRYRKASDPRDIIFSILGLVAEQAYEELKPNYELSVEKVYINVAKTIITRSSSLECLDSAYPKHNYHLPSWVPDWTLNQRQCPEAFSSREKSHEMSGSYETWRKLYNASRNLVPEISFSNNDTRLLARGIQFDIVTAISERRPRDDEKLEKVWEDWVAFADPSEAPYVAAASSASSTRREVLERLLSGGIKMVYADGSAVRGISSANMVEPGVDVFERHGWLIDKFTWNRRLFVSSKGYLGVGPDTVKPRDTVCILFGAQTPSLLRVEGDFCLFVGQAYIDGIMDGEALEGVDVMASSQLFAID